MKSIIQIPRIPLFTEIEEPQSYAIYIFGTDNRLLQDADTFGDALARYLNEYNISQDMFARMTGISQCTISRYLKNERKIRQRYLCAVCMHSGFTRSDRDTFSSKAIILSQEHTASRTRLIISSVII